MEPLKTSWVIIITLAILLGLSLTFSWVTREGSRLLSTSFDRERLKSEALLSEKLQSQKELQKFKDKFFELREKNYDHKHAAEIGSSKIKEMNTNLERLLAENRLLRSEKAEAFKSLLNYESKLLVTQRLNDKLQTEKTQLKNSNSLLQHTNSAFSKELTQRKLTDIDNVHFQAVKNNPSKLTIRASKTSKIIGRFDAPENITHMNFSIFQEDGKELTAEDGEFISALTLMPTDHFALVSGSLPANTLTRRQLVYVPKSKLTPGTYRIKVNNDTVCLRTIYVTLQ